MIVAPTPNHLMYNLEAMNSGDAKRKWKEAIKKAWDDRCAYCGTPPIEERSLLTIDHVRPRSRGGEDRTSNCIPACKRCNHAKGSQDWLEWFRLQPFYSMETEFQIKHWLETGEVLRYDDPGDTEWYNALVSDLTTGVSQSSD